MRIRVFIKEHGNSLSIVKIGTQVVARIGTSMYGVMGLWSRFDPAAGPHCGSMLPFGAKLAPGGITLRSEVHAG